MSRSEDQAALKAAGMLVKRGGGLEFQLVEREGTKGRVYYYARATMPPNEKNPEGANYLVGEGQSVTIACDRLAMKMLEGAACRRCGHVISLWGADPTLCHWRRRHDVWVSGCGRPVDKNIEMVARR